VAFETRTQLGTVVGYQIGMETKSSHQTNILYMTYGIMIQKLLHGKISYSHIILDEVHERSLEMDFCFVILKKILEKSKTKLIIMSATINSEKFAAYFGYYP
jgi:HrpA-like RNA helicase